MVKKILLGVAAVIALFLLYVAIQPSEFHVERSAVMNAAPDEVFAQVNDFQKWEAWSPWAKIDPAAKNSFEGPESGKGAIFRWAGNSEVGEGSMTIVESKPSELVDIKLSFLKPMEGDSDVKFLLKPEGEKTHVTWSMSGRSNFIGRIFCTLMNMNMEREIGDKYAEGLASIKAIVEKRDEGANASPPPATAEATSPTPESAPAAEEPAPQGDAPDEAKPEAESGAEN